MKTWHDRRRHYWADGSSLPRLRATRFVAWKRPPHRRSHPRVPTTETITGPPASPSLPLQRHPRLLGACTACVFGLLAGWTLWLAWGDLATAHRIATGLLTSAAAIESMAPGQPVAMGGQIDPGAPTVEPTQRLAMYVEMYPSRGRGSMGWVETGGVAPPVTLAVDGGTVQVVNQGYRLDYPVAEAPGLRSGSHLAAFDRAMPSWSSGPKQRAASSRTRSGEGRPLSTAVPARRKGPSWRCWGYRWWC